MALNDWWIVLLLGVVEGLTEFLPVSSTGHLLLIGHFLGFQSAGNSFEVLIQLGAILALLSVYAQKMLQLVFAAPRDAQARRFLIGLALAFAPALVLGALLHDFIKTVLFESPQVICWSLILGGIVLLAIDRARLPVRVEDPLAVPPLRALAIGLCQCLALVPGVSRSGATIAGAMVLGLGKRAAAEFSFLLALPTMSAAFAYDLIKNIDQMSLADGAQIGLGFGAAFVTALLVVKGFLAIVGRFGFTPFAIWRIGVGAVGLLALNAPI